MQRALIPSLSLTLMALSMTALGTTAAYAGGERCRKAAAAQQARLGADCAQSAEACLSAMSAKIRSKGWLGIETGKTADGR